jgi:enoyl-CoA hydratase/carnithine racemase
MHPITVSDPGEGQRLDDAELSNLHDSLKAARTAAAVLLIIEGDAWAEARGASASAAKTVELVHSLPMPVVCHATGRVTGVGLALALACDLRLAGPMSTWGLGDPAHAAGVGSGTSWLLHDRVGSALLDHLTWTGEVLTAEDAATSHLVSAVADVPTAIARAERLATLPATTASALKRGTRAGRASLLVEQLGYERWLRRSVEAS